MSGHVERPDRPLHDNVIHNTTDVNDGVMDTLSGVPPRSADPHLRERIINTAARLLATEGSASARRLARELGTSTMVVYTHFGGMDELTRQVMRRGSKISEPSWIAARSLTMPSPTG